MKSRMLLLVAMLVTVCLTSAVALAEPIEISYQGRLLTAAGQSAPDGDYTILYRLYDDSTGGAILWEETQVVTVRGGLFSVFLGSVTPLDFSALHATTPGHKYIDVSIAGEAPMRPRVRLTTAPLSAVSLSVRGDVVTGPGQLSLSKADAKRALEALTSASRTGITILDTLTRDTSYSLMTVDDPSRVTSQTLRTVSPAGDTISMRTSVDTSGVHLSGVWKKDFQVDSFFDIVADNTGARSKLRAFGFESSIAVKTEGVGIAFIDTTNNDTSVVIRADSSGNSGGTFSGAKKVAKFKAGADLATAVNRMAAGASRAGAFVDLTVPVDHYVEISVDSMESSLVFADTSGNVLMMQKARHDAMMATIQNMRAVAPSGDTSDVVTAVDTSTASVRVRRSNRVSTVGFGSVTVTKRPNAVSPGDKSVSIIADNNEVSLTISQSGGGAVSSEVRVADDDNDGVLDLRVDGRLTLGSPSGTNILTVAQGSLTDPIADAWTTYSSRRWKKNIEPIQGAVDKVKKLRGVEYDWKASDKHDIGLIAEEVGEVIPEVVVYEENGVDAKSVDYPRLVALLIQALKEQQVTIESQQGQIDGLTQNLVAMKALASQVAQIQEALLQLTSSNSNKPTKQYGMK